MNGQKFGERVNTSEDVERTGPGTNSPVEDSDSFTYNGPVLAALVQEAPTGGGVVAVGPVDEAIASEAAFDINAGSLTALLEREESGQLRTRWNEIQGKFVDEPRSAVQQADGLVSEVIKKITQMFADEHGSLEGQWKEGNDVSTEDLRKALQHYRSFFNRLVI
ncbi:MAG TPA: hypothetical protein VJ022_10460 [Anaerolineales bacterium]|nr:hypothetical protein [Anaerolineales bacterium]